MAFTFERFPPFAPSSWFSMIRTSPACTAMPAASHPARFRREIVKPEGLDVPRDALLEILDRERCLQGLPLYAQA